MEYPRTVVLEDERLKTLLNEKEELVLTGRTMSDDINAMEVEMEEIDHQLVELEKAVDISDLKAKADELTGQVNAFLQQMEELNKQTRERITAAMPPELKEKYDVLKKTKEDKEIERNKIALKVQQKADKIIPLGQKVMKQYLLDEYDDYDTLRIENGQVVGTIFNHLDDFKKAFKKK